jgi:integrase
MYTHRGSQVARIIGDLDLFVLQKSDVIDYVKRRSEEGAHSHTIYKELVTLRRTLKHHEIEPAGVVPPFKSGYVPTKRWLSRDQYGALRLEPARQLWVAGAVLMGGRKDEIEKTTWEDINWETWEIHVRGTKTPGSDRFVPLTELLARLLFAHALATAHPKLPSGPIFGKWTKACRDLKAACEKAAIPLANPTALRHTYGSWLVQQGVPISVVAKLMGNSVAMVERVYGHLDRETFRRAGQRLVEYHQERAAPERAANDENKPDAPAQPAEGSSPAEEPPPSTPASRWSLVEID